MTSPNCHNPRCDRRAVDTLLLSGCRRDGRQRAPRVVPFGRKRVGVAHRGFRCSEVTAAAEEALVYAGYARWRRGRALINSRRKLLPSWRSVMNALRPLRRVATGPSRPAVSRYLLTPAGAARHTAALPARAMQGRCWNACRGPAWPGRVRRSGPIAALLNDSSLALVSWDGFWSDAMHRPRPAPPHSPRAGRAVAETAPAR